MSDEAEKEHYARTVGVHMSHCYQGEQEDHCKYGDDDCPAKPKFAETSPSEANATLRLAMNSEKSPHFRKAEAKARLKLAAAIILMDAKQDIIGQHNLYEQQLVNEALREYGNALASLVRDEEKPQ